MCDFVVVVSKDWPFNQKLDYLWSFLSISAFVSINFCNFAVKQQKSIMAKLNRIRVEALIAIANALEVPVQELVRQEEFNQEK